MGIEQRGIELLRLIATGNDPAAIAKKQVISESKIKSRIRFWVLKPLRARNRANAVAIGLRRKAFVCGRLKRALSEPLTAREQQALEMIAEGETDKRIGRKLCPWEGPHAGSHLVRVVKRKLKASNREHAVYRGFQHKLLS